MMNIEIIKTTNPKKKPEGALGFGKYFTDHMFTMEYKDGKWQNPQIRPYENFSLPPSCSVLHYGQGVFEGAKAYKNEKGEVRTFRLSENIERMAQSCERVSIPEFDKDFCLNALEELIKIDSDWIPT